MICRRCDLASIRVEFATEELVERLVFVEILDQDFFHVDFVRLDKVLDARYDLWPFLIVDPSLCGDDLGIRNVDI